MKWTGRMQYRLQVWRKIRPYVKNVKAGYAGDVITEILVRICNLLFPVLYGILLEKIILDGEMELLTYVMVGYLLLQLAKSALLILQRICRNKVVRELTCGLKGELMEGYLERPVREYIELSSGDLKMTLEDGVDRLGEFPAANFRYWLNMIYIIGIALVLFGINRILTLVALLSIPVTFFLDYLVSRGEKKVNNVLNKNDASWATWLDASIREWKEIRVYQCEEKQRKAFRNFQATDEKYFSSWIRYWVTRVLVIPKIKDDFFMQFLMYFLGGILIYYHHITIGVLLVFIQYFNMLSEQVKAVSGEDAELQAGMVHYERVMQGLADRRADGPEESKVGAFTGITLDKVGFCYEQDGEQLLKEFDLHIDKGEKVGIMGESGSGKSTLLKLMLGILEPASGTIRFGQQSLKNLDKKALYRNVAYISQESRLYNDSILENLRLVKEDATPEEIRAACKRAGIYDVIRSLPEGLDTVIGENGSALSGGQRQRLILAKAFLKDPMVYFFDEATSALDNQIEEMVNESITRIPGDRTVVIVAHKESALKVCQRLVRL